MNSRSARSIGVAVAGTVLLLFGVSCSVPPESLRPSDPGMSSPSVRPATWPDHSDRLVPMLFLQAQQPDGAQRTVVPLFEILPDGSARVIDARDDVVADGIQPVPEGGLVIVGSGGSAVSTDAVVMGDDGEVQRRADISMARYGTGLLSVESDARLILQRVPLDDGGSPVGTVDVTARSLSSGSEDVLMTLDRPVYTADAAIGSLVLAGGGPSFDESEMLPCWVESVRTDVTEPVASDEGRQSIELPGCDLVTELKVSPDARFAAVAFQAFDTEEMRVSIVRLADLAVVETQEVSIRVGNCERCQFSAMGGYLGMAWPDRTTLRVARMTNLPLSMSQDRIAQVLESHLDLKEMKVPSQ